MKTLARGGFLALGLALSACATTTVQRDMLQTSMKVYTVVVISDMKANDDLWQSYAVRMHRGLAEKLAASKAFVQILDPAMGSVPADAVVITGNLTEADKGSVAARWIIGFGAGRSHLTAEFQLADPDGKVLGTFSVRKAYSGGAGIGGANLLDMDDLAQQVGEATADTLVNWAMTGEL